jgi:3-oxoadipate enol-lactonase
VSFVETGGVRLHYRVDGPDDAPVVVLVNALGTDHGMWNRQIADFTAHFRVVRHDSRGHGQSDSPSGPYSIELLGMDVLALLDALAIPSAHICGVSTGGMVAQWLAARHPDRIRRAVLASTAARVGSEDLWDERAGAVASGGIAAVREQVMRRLLTDSFRKHDPGTTREIAAALESCSPDGYAATCIALRDADFSELVADIRLPSLVVVGAEDVATPIADARWLHEHIAGSELVVLDDASHLCNIEQPRRFTAAALGFLASDTSVTARD